jgi:hypothetical protein
MINPRSYNIFIAGAAWLASASINRFGPWRFSESFYNPIDSSSDTLPSAVVSMVLNRLFLVSSNSFFVTRRPFPPI